MKRSWRAGRMPARHSYFRPNSPLNTSSIFPQCTISMEVVCIIAVFFLWLDEITMRRKPSFSASVMRCSTRETGRISPVKPTSPAKQVCGSMGMSRSLLSTATITAKSIAVSIILMPPATLRKTSFVPSLKPARRSRTARSILRRFWS